MQFWITIFWRSWTPPRCGKSWTACMRGVWRGRISLSKRAKRVSIYTCLQVNYSLFIHYTRIYCSYTCLNLVEQSLLCSLCKCRLLPLFRYLFTQVKYILQVKDGLLHLTRIFHFSVRLFLLVPELCSSARVGRVNTSFAYGKRYIRPFWSIVYVPAGWSNPAFLIIREFLLVKSSLSDHLYVHACITRPFSPHHVYAC